MFADQQFNWMTWPEFFVVLRAIWQTFVIIMVIIWMVQKVLSYRRSVRRYRRKA